ncbi:MAG: cellulose synthase family protein [Planctomycetota bacterium]|jgi:cellulose synthase/poly-beta-1,6-N-acetylglucosamine synthase-like glycosyltransferase
MDRNTVLLAVYIFVFTMVCIYGLHRYQLVYLYYKHRRNTPRIQRRFQRLPRVTVQLPMYNERYVARRVIELACGIEYPRDRLQIQVLDDSTDDTVEVARQAVEDMRRLGHEIVYIHRDNRHGYKAGALQEGLETATGEFVCIFDADFLPPPGILHKTIHHFTDDRVGMVQARWEHINRDYSLLTKTQAVLLDGHFVMEHGARNRSGRFMSFNGTAGIWRISCISDAGGWQHDTLTEDLDLSYRAQLKGWEFLFLPDLCSPAELPPEMEAFKAQQYRWAKGGAQTCRKVLPRILRSPVPLKVKWEAFFHLTSCTVYLYMVLLTVLLFPVLYMGVGIPQHRTVWGALLDASLFLIATCSASSFYACSQRELARTWADSIKYLPFLMALGVGISLNNARAALSGFFGRASEFVRTPKFGVDRSTGSRWKRCQAYRKKRRLRLQPCIELGMGTYLLACVVLCIESHWISIGLPFLMLFCVGYFYVGLSSLLADWLRQTGGAAEEAADLHAPVTRVQTLPESADLPGARQ